MVILGRPMSIVGPFTYHLPRSVSIAPAVSLDFPTSFSLYNGRFLLSHYSYK